MPKFVVNNMFVPLSAVQGVVVVGYGSGHIRLFSLEDGHIMCEVSSTVQYSTVQYSTVQYSTVSKLK